MLTAKKINLVHFRVGPARINVGRCGSFIRPSFEVDVGCEEDFGLKNGGGKRGKETCYTLLNISVGTCMCLFTVFCVGRPSIH